MTRLRRTAAVLLALPLGLSACSGGDVDVDAPAVSVTPGGVDVDVPEVDVPDVDVPDVDVPDVDVPDVDVDADVDANGDDSGEGAEDNAS